MGNSGKYIICRNIHTGEAGYFESVSKISKYFEVDKETIKLCITTNRLFIDTYSFTIGEEYTSEYDQFEGSEYINEDLYLEECMRRGSFNDCIRWQKESLTN